MVRGSGFRVRGVPRTLHARELLVFLAHTATFGEKGRKNMFLVAGAF